MRTASLVLVPLLLGMSCLVAVATAPSAAFAARSNTFGVDVDYVGRPCTSSGKRTVEQLPGAAIELRSAGKVVGRGRLNSTGHASVSAKGDGPYDAFVILDGPKVAVKEILSHDTYEFPVGKVRKGGAVSTKLQGMDAAGAANIFAVLTQAAAFATKASPRPLPKVSAFWVYGAKANSGLEFDEMYGTAYDESSNRIDIQKQYVFDDLPIAHEYGHHVLQQTAPPGPKATGEHVFTSVYPSKMELPWSEGFANAFAALALDTPTPKLDCKRLFDFSGDDAKPAIKPAKHMQFGQANEVMVGAVVWDMANRFGGDRGTPAARAAGLKKLLGAIRARSGALGHPVRTARQMHDAILVSSALAPDHAAAIEIEQRFAKRDLAWGMEASLDVADISFQPFDKREKGQLAQHDFTLTLTGPGGMRCTSLSNGSSREAHQTGYPDISVSDTFPGALPRTGLDDCIGRDQSVLTQSVRLALPFAAGDPKHTGKYTLSATYTCTPTTDDWDPEESDHPRSWHECTDDRLVEVTLETGASASANLCDGSPMCSGGALAGNGRQLAISGTQVLATFEGDGWCQAPLFTGFDCSTGG